MKPQSWTVEEAIRLVHRLEQAVSPAGFHVGVAGSVLLYGMSKNDLDLIVFPHTTGSVDMNGLYAALEGAGLVCKVARSVVATEWRRKGSLDTKHVERWLFNDRIVDLFFLR